MIPMILLNCHSSDSRCCAHTLQPPPVQPGVSHTRSSSQAMQMEPSLCGLRMAMLDIGQRRWPTRGQLSNNNYLCTSSISLSWPVPAQDVLLAWKLCGLRRQSHRHFQVCHAKHPPTLALNSPACRLIFYMPNVWHLAGLAPR